MAGLLDYIVPGSDGGGLVDYLKRNLAALDPSVDSTPSFADQIKAMGNKPQFPAVSGNPSFATIPQGLFPSPALPNAPQFAPPTAAPSAAPAPASGTPTDDDGEDSAPASPINVGNYSMPRIGDASDFQSTGPAALPANSQPTQGQLPSAPATPTGGPLSGFFNRTADALGSISRGGSLAGAVRGQFDDPTTKAAQTQNMTARALIAKGVDPATAIAAVQPGNTDMLKNLITQAFSKGRYTQETDKDGNVWNVDTQTGQRTVALQSKDDKFTNVTVKNPDGTETIRPFNSKTGEYGAPIGPAPGSGGTSGIDPNLTGQPRMDALMAANPDYGRKIQSMVNGDLPLPTSGQAARSPQAQRMVEDALAVSGSTSASDFATRAATRKDYASGIASRVTKSLNTTIQHAGQLDSLVDALGNYSYFPGVANYIHDKVASNTDPAYQVAKAKFEETKEAFVKELDFTLSGGHSSVSGSAELRDKINRADSPAALHAAIQSALHLLAARLDSHTKGFVEGTKSQRDPQDFIYPENRPIFDRLLGAQDTSTGAGVPGVTAGATPSATPISPLKVGQSFTAPNGVTIKRVGP